MEIVWIVCLTMMMTSRGLSSDTFPGASDELNKSRQDLNVLLTKYTDQYPLVVAKREQIAGLEKSVAPQWRAQQSPQPAPALGRVRELQKALQELNHLLTKYTDQHPLVVAKHQQIIALEKSLKSD